MEVFPGCRRLGTTVRRSQRLLDHDAPVQLPRRADTIQENPEKLHPPVQTVCGGRLTRKESPHCEMERGERMRISTGLVAFAGSYVMPPNQGRQR
jgi:hypothetical protein